MVELKVLGQHKFFLKIATLNSTYVGIKCFYMSGFLYKNYILMRVLKMVKVDVHADA